jgi:hypothetical protein
MYVLFIKFRGVKKKKPGNQNRNRKIGNPKPGSRFRFQLKKKKKKIEDPDSGPSFWHLIKTGKSEPGAYIYNNNFLNILYI